MDAWIGVVGTLLGGFFGFFGSYLVERGRRKHEDLHRFSADRRSLYARFLRLSEEYRAALGKWHDEVRLEQSDISRALREAGHGYDPQEPSSDDLYFCLEELNLLASKPTRMAGMAVCNELWWYRDHDTNDHAGLSESAERIARARTGFYRAARAELGIPELSRHPWSGLVDRLRGTNTIKPAAPQGATSFDPDED